MRFGFGLALVVYFSVMGYAQTLPPRLRCVTPLSNGDVRIVWEPQPYNCGPISIYGATSRSGPYTLIATVPLTPSVYVHTGANANVQTWYYYLTDDVACNGSPVVPSDTLDSQQPTPPELVRASVVTNDSVLVEWQPSREPDVWAYLVYVYDSAAGNFILLDTVRHPLTRYWHTKAHLLRKAEADLHPETYTIAAMDSCGTAGILQPQTHTTIFLEGSIQRCQEQMHLQWTAYQGEAVLEYAVEVNINRPGWRADSVLRDTATRIYAFPFHQEGDTVCFRVRARLTTGVAVYSNQVCVVADFVKSPDVVQMLVATVDEDTNVVVQWWIDSTADLTRMVVRRR